MWFDVIELIRLHRRFLVSSHEHPDGDAVGSMLALALLLDDLGKEPLLVLDDPVPRIYRFLDPDGRIRRYEPARDDPALAACDVAFVLDVGSLDRVGKVGAALARRRLPTVCIDHHQTNGAFADVNVVVRDAPSTASLVLDLVRALGRTPSPAMADALLTGLATDTGWFRFPNTSPQALRDAAALREAGADPARIYARVYEDLSAARMRLLGRAMADLRQEADGRLVYFVVTRAMLAEAGAQDSEVEGFVDSFRKIGGVQLIVFLREQPDGRTRVSLRAKGDLDVGTLAAQFGGGGHRAAAGAVLDEPLAAAMPRVLAAARRLLNG